MELIGRKRLNFLVLIILFPMVVMFFSLFIGRYPIEIGKVLNSIGYKFMNMTQSNKDVIASVIFDIRLPRAILGFLVGGALAISGATLQGVFKNPLVDSGMLGVSSGASFGAILGFVFLDGKYIMVLLLAFTFGTLAVGLSYMIGSFYKSVPTIMLVLGGVIVSSIFSSLVSLGKYMADPYDELPAIVFWLMGSLASASYLDIYIISIPIFVGCLVIFALRWRINVLSLGDREAISLGVNVRLTKGILILCTTFVTAAAVSVSGTIGWIGLIIPHIARMIIGNDNRYLIPSSFLLGGGFLILTDILSRTITTSEIPIGILTSLIGAPFYIFLLRRTKGSGWV